MNLFALSAYLLQEKMIRPSGIFSTSLEVLTPENSLNGMTIRYGFHPTPFGECLIGVCARGICWLSFVKEEKEDLQELFNFWKKAAFIPTGETAPEVKKVFNHQPVTLLMRGTPFQAKVWKALLSIPQGNVTSYQHIAQSIGQPKSAQAVGSAVGANTIGYAIPCHRVVRRDGTWEQFRWGKERKREMLEKELLNEKTG